MIFNSGILL